MISNDCSTTRKKTDPGGRRSSNCYRPLQQLYKTVYSPTNIACISRPSERYKTTNMTYGSFHYNNWAFVQKNRPVNYDRKRFAGYYDKVNKQQKMNLEKGFLFNTSDSNEIQNCTQPTTDAYCPIDC